MRTRILSVIAIGITIGFLMGMGFVALLAAAIDGGTPGLEITFTIMCAMMGGALFFYVIKTIR